MKEALLRSFNMAVRLCAMCNGPLLQLLQVICCYYNKKDKADNQIRIIKPILDGSCIRWSCASVSFETGESLIHPFTHSERNCTSFHFAMLTLLRHNAACQPFLFVKPSLISFHFPQLEWVDSLRSSFDVKQLLTFFIFHFSFRASNVVSTSTGEFFH